MHGKIRLISIVSKPILIVVVVIDVVFVKKMLGPNNFIFFEAFPKKI